MVVFRLAATVVLASMLAVVAGASAAPSTSTLFFMTLDRGTGEAHWYVVNAAGGRMREVGTYAPTFDRPTVSISPDGTRIAYSCGRGLCVRAVGSARVDMIARSSRPVRIHAFAWSPDSQRFAFVRGTALWRVNADGRGQRRLARLPGPEMTVSWSPRGSFLLLKRRRIFRPTGAVSIAFFVARADGSRLRRLVGGTDISSAASWSRDERRLAFGTGASRPNGIGTGWIHVVDVRTGRRTRFVRGNDPLYSPVDGRMAVLRWDADQDATLFVVDASARARRLYPFAYFPAWSPDGREIADSASGLVATDARTGRRRTIARVRLPAAVAFVQWAGGR
jgi:Tol biopolymer transport system component